MIKFMRNVLAIVAAILATGSTIPYIIDILRGRTKPNLVSWFTWTLLTAIAMAAAFADNQPRTAILLLGSTVCTGSVVLLGFKYGRTKFTLFDGLCQLGAVAGLLLWLIFNSPVFAMVASVSIDLVGLLPTIRHSWLKPGEETWQTFMIGVAAPVLTMSSLEIFNVTSLLYPAYLVVANGSVASIVILRRKQAGISLARHGIHETLHE